MDALIETPLCTLAAEEKDGAITKLLFMPGAKLAGPHKDSPLMARLRKWIADYFAGLNPDPGKIPIAPNGTKFQKEVWRLTGMVGYGRTASYGDIARTIGLMRQGRMSAQAVGQALTRNPIVLLIPCHRIVATGGIGGYGFGGSQGISEKRFLLALEGNLRDEWK